LGLRRSLLRASRGKVFKPKYNIKVHLWGGISRKGLTNLVIFEGEMNSTGFQDILTVGLLPFLENNPEGHRFFQGDDSKYTISNDIKQFMIINCINNYQMPPESPDLNPIEMVWNDIKYYLSKEVRPKTKNELIEGIRTFWNKKRDDLDYCNEKIDHLYKVIDRIVALTGVATGL
jgi:hypothetical protein